MVLGRKNKKAQYVAKRRKLTQLDENTSDKNSFLSSQAARKAELRSQEDLLNRKRRLDSDAASKALRRSKENRVKRCFRNMKNASCTKISRSIETPDQHTFRHAKNAESTAASRLNETPEQSSLRRATNTQRTAESRLNETPEQSSLRRATNTQRTAESRLNETPEQHALRLTSDAVATALSRAKLRTDFQNSINKFADTICLICNKLCYSKQVQSVRLASLPENILPNELIAQHDVISACHRCVGILRKSRTPTQAYWNNMSLDEIPPEIASLSDVEVRLLSRIIPFVKMVKLGGRFGQHGFHGQAVLFGQDVEEIAEQLPLRISSAGLVIICEQLESVERLRQFSVNIQKLRAALDWLIANNPLYRNVTVNFNNENYDVHKFVMFKMMTGKQCTSNAAVAITAAKIKETDTWSPNIIDSILISGDRLYSSSIQSRRVPNTAEADVEYLRVHELQVNFEALSHSCLLQIQDETSSICGHLTVSIDGFPNLKNGLIQFFTESDVDGGAIVTCNGVSVAIWKNDNLYYLFDSHSRGPKGRVAQDGTACLMSFTNITQLWSVLKSNLPKSQGNRPDDDQYSITKITPGVHRLHQNETELQNDIYTTANTQQLQSSELTNENIVITSSVLRVVDEPIPELSTVIENNNCDQLPVHQLRRKTDAPLQIAREKRAEELSWFKLFPYGRNGLQENRAHSITPLDYCQARIMGADNRFQRHDYLFYALSVMEFYRAKQNVGVVLRMRQGENRPENLVENIHLNMRNMRGSNAYWQSACSGLIAMVKNIGPPTWFLTLSCNDLNWNDILKALLIAAGRGNENPTDLTFNDKQALVDGHPVTLSRQFMIRVNAFMNYLKNDHHILGGNVTDFWWRIEFQNRGSPHLHMLCWIQNAPNFDTPQGKKLISDTVSCSLNNADDELNDIVKRVQIHSHSTTCYKNRQDQHCRFNFPRPASGDTVLLGPDETLRNNGRFCILTRKPEEQYVNNYNPQILKLCKGNMDIQPCGNVTAVSYYIAKYTSKHEPQDVGQAVKDAVSKVRSCHGDIGRQLFAVSMAILNHRRVSACECAYRLCHLKLRDSSRKVVFVNTCRPHERYRMLRYDSDDGQTYQNIFDRYIQRPTNLEHLSLAEFAVNYEHTSRFVNDEENGDTEAYEDLEEGTETTRNSIRLLNGSIMKRRRKPAILRTRYYTQTGDREGYFYSYLVAHVPFRNEDDLLADFETCEEAFMEQRNLLRPFHGDSVEQFQFIERELQQVIGQVLALAEPPLLNNFNGQQTENFDVGAIVEGYDPRMADADVDIEGEEVEESSHINITDAEFHHIVRSMNLEQKKIYDEVTKRIRDEVINEANTNVPLKLFVTGGAGSGKSFILKTLVHHIRRCYAPTVDQLLNASFVEVTAPTGVAARLVNGKTLHSAFSLGIEKGRATVYRQMTGQRLEDMRRKWRYIRWLVIDEISMVSYEVLRSIHLRLQEFKNCPDIFGGVNILVFGDIMQLSPVKGSWCFKQPLVFQGEPHLWHYFGLCELQTNVRQQNDSQFIDILNNLRVGELSMEQYEILLERSRVPLTGDFADGNFSRS
ncbi:hypothetical protein HF086_002508 [Spodoptera exigua]|uniref:ATP-dependent DNA helicase n=1 Tax=Spodoptera exigua TaxID=7107 RepID=A0A922MP18_SPOEX|nr:hypothetical protein HF086_002508 [Spodoptera exigua]